MVLANRPESGRRASNSFLPDHDTLTCISTNFFLGLGLGGEFHPLSRLESTALPQRTYQTLRCFRLAHNCPKFHQLFVGHFRTVGRGDIHPRFFPVERLALVPGRDASPVSATPGRRCRPRWAYFYHRRWKQSPCGVPPDPKGPSVAASSGRRRHVVQQWQEPRRAACVSTVVAHPTPFRQDRILTSFDHGQRVERFEKGSNRSATRDTCVCCNMNSETRAQWRRTRRGRSC